MYVVGGAVTTVILWLVGVIIYQKILIMDMRVDNRELVSKNKQLKIKSIQDTRECNNTLFTNEHKIRIKSAKDSIENSKGLDISIGNHTLNGL